MIPSLSVTKTSNKLKRFPSTTRAYGWGVEWKTAVKVWKALETFAVKFINLAFHELNFNF